jgi:hypothetical protein
MTLTEERAIAAAAMIGQDFPGSDLAHLALKRPREPCSIQEHGQRSCDQSLAPYREWCSAAVPYPRSIPPAGVSGCLLISWWQLMGGFWPASTARMPMTSGWLTKF